MRELRRILHRDGFGLMLVLAVLFTPRGVLGVFESIGKYFSERTKS